MVMWGDSRNGETPIAGWFIMENPISMDYFRGTTILGNLHVEAT
jgi:hypothetical protein